MKPISASHIGSWILCKRRERFAYGLGLREPPSLPTEAGSKTHKIIETNSAADQEWNGYPLGVMAQKLIEASPPEILSREENFTQEIDGIPFTGVIDFTTPDTVGDYKTTGKRRNIKTLKYLETDPQRLLYVEVKKPRRTLWLYGVWEDLTVTPREIIVEPKVDRERFKLHVLTPAEEIAALSPDTDPLSLPANLDSCRLFPPVGCPYQDRCFPAAKTAERIGNRMSDLANRLRAEAEAARGGASAPPRINAPNVVVAPPELPPEPAQSLEEPKKRRGRPRKTAEPVAEVPVNPELQAAENARERAEKVTGSAEFRQQIAWDAPAEALPTLTDPPAHLVENLYIDCIPLTFNALHSYKLIAEAAQTVADDVGLPHAMLVDFAKGGPMVAAQLIANLRKNPVRDLVISTKSPEGKACMTALMGVAKNVVQGGFF